MLEVVQVPGLQGREGKEFGGAGKTEEPVLNRLF
jgi:hypothetical protein